MHLVFLGGAKPADFEEYGHCLGRDGVREAVGGRGQLWKGRRRTRRRHGERGVLPDIALFHTDDVQCTN